jgi:hypothetical protein
MLLELHGLFQIFINAPVSLYEQTSPVLPFELQVRLNGEGLKKLFYQLT